MAQFYTLENRTQGNSPPQPAGNELVNGGRVRIYRATIFLDAPATSSTTAGTVITTSDTVFLARKPAGWRFIRGVITSSVSLGTSTVAIGTATATGKHRTAAVFTATDTPTVFGNTAAQAEAALNADENIILTVGVASLPNTAGARLVIDMEFGGP